MNIENLKNAVKKLTNFELAYGLALQLNHKYDFGGYSVGRSERSFLLDFFLRLNYEKLTLVSSLDPFVNLRIFLSEGKQRLITKVSGGKNKSLEFMDTKEHFSVVVLYLWIIHYRVKMAELKVLEKCRGDLSLNDIDFSFSSEIERAELIYVLCLSEAGIPESIICSEALKYLHHNSNEGEHLSKQPYKLDLSWRVDDLCVT